MGKGRNRFSIVWVLELLVAGLMISCVTEFQPDLVSISSTLVVDGQITDQPGPYTIRLTRTADYSYSSLNLAEMGATVTISDNRGTQEVLKEQSPGGTYVTSASGILGIAGRSYKLTIQTKAGKRYESTAEVLPAVPPIQKLYYESRYIPSTGGLAGQQTWEVFLDTQDPDTLGNYYKWNWTHYEFTDACRKTYVPVPPPGHYSGIGCCSDCWDITRCYTCINVSSDIDINGKAISRQPIMEVPFTSLGKYYLEIEQQGISKGAYQFWKSVRGLVNNTGGLFDAAPASIQGNLRCISNPGEPIYGYFGASGLSATYIFVDRSAGQGSPKADFPTIIPYPTNPPCLVCENSLYRTPIKPRWWSL
jgi:hypothetical protein